MKTDPHPDSLNVVYRLASRAADLRAQRDNAIRDAIADGHSLRTVAAAAEMSHAAIARIVRR